MARMLRESLRSTFAGDGENPSLLFSRGLREWPEDATQRGNRLTEFIKRVAHQPAPQVYVDVFHRWYDLVRDETRFARWIGSVDGRLFIGLGGAHVVETNLTLSRPYGVPLIPGSSLKGLARAHAKAAGLDGSTRKVLFGQGGERPEDDESGYLIFHDAWWVPSSAATPFAREVVTVHHPNYYGKQGEEPATDFDSPNPNVQLAARGSFLFVVEGALSWAEFGRKILQNALETVGIGGKVAAGCGYFKADNDSLAALEEEAGRRDAERKKRQKELELKALPRAEQLRHFVHGLDDKKLADMFSRDFNKTRREYGEEFDLLRRLVLEERRGLVETWSGAPKDSNQRKAHKKLTSETTP